MIKVRDDGRKKIFGGVAVLTLSTLAVKITGLLYKIPLIKLVGIEGMAYFLAAYHIYALIFVLSTAGLPVATSVLVSKSLAKENRRETDKVFRVSLVLFSSVGAIFSALMFGFSGFIAETIKIPEASLCIKAVAPAVLFSTAGSAVRGYFQGFQNMKPTALSQLIESICKLALGIFFVHLAIFYGATAEVSSAAAILGLTVGTLLSTLYLFAKYLFFKKRIVPSIELRESKTTKEIIKELLAVALPVTVGAVVINVTGIADTMIVPSRLIYGGFDSSSANVMYSAYGNVALPLFNMVPSFLSSVATVLTPAVAGAVCEKRFEKESELICSGVKSASFLSIPAALGLAVFGREIIRFIYTSEESATISAPLLSVISPAIMFLSFITVSNAVLQAENQASKPIISMGLGALVKIVSEYFLTAIPSVNIYGAAISTLLCYAVIAATNVYFIEKHTAGIKGVGGVFIRPLVAAVFATAVALVLRAFTGANIIIVIIVDAIVYFVFAAKTNAVTKDDMTLLPAGEKIYGILNKVKLMR